MSGTFDNQRERFKGGPRTASKKRSHILRAAARRKILPGFPIEHPFYNLDEIKAYLHGTTILCLRCGKNYKALGVHLLKIHGWTEGQYRAHYNLPLRCGLTAEATKEKKRAHGKRRFVEGNLLIVGNRETQAIAHSAPHRATGFTKLNALKNLEKCPTPPRFWSDGDYLKIPDLMEAHDLTLKEVQKHFDVPQATAIRRYTKQNAHFRNRLHAAYENISFPAQARAENLGTRFWGAVRLLRPMGDKKIGALLGVSAMAVNRGRRKMGIL